MKKAIKAQQGASFNPHSTPLGFLAVPLSKIELLEMNSFVFFKKVLILKIVWSLWNGWLLKEKQKKKNNLRYLERFEPGNLRPTHDASTPHVHDSRVLD